MATVHDLAAYIIDETDGPMSTMKLQKLCYYSQAYSLAWFNTPIFQEEIQAWTNGPVIKSLWKSHRGQFIVEEIPDGRSGNLTMREKAVADAVITAMGGLTGKQLSDRTHSEEPWIKRYDGDDNYPDGVITWEDLREFYGKKNATVETTAPGFQNPR